MSTDTPVDLESVIKDSIDEATDDPIVEPGSVNDTPEPVESMVANPAPDDASETPVSDTPAESSIEVKSPAPVEPAVEDPFAKEYGISPTMSSGRENRIPYSRVKAINEKAVEKAVAPLRTELETYKTKATDYEGRLQKVAEFEQVMTSDAQRFLGMLETLPAYKPFFDWVRQAQQFIQTQSAQPKAEPTAQPVSPVTDDMPQPDQDTGDGKTKVYSQEGLKKLLDWNAAQAEKRALDKFNERVAPMEQQWKTQRYLEETVIPQVNAQVAEARTWPLFKENEQEIVKVMQQYPQASLERVYQHVVLPKLQAQATTAAQTAQVDRATLEKEIRAQVLKEIKSAPVSTSVPVQAVKTGPVSDGTPRNLEDVIREQVRTSFGS